MQDTDTPMKCHSNSAIHSCHILTIFSKGESSVFIKARQPPVSLRKIKNLNQTILKISGKSKPGQNIPILIFNKNFKAYI